MVCSRFGQESWEEIKQKAEVEVDVFISMEGYPNDMTNKLVKGASVVLNLSPSEIMQAQTQSRDEGTEHDEFLVKYQPN